jgi:hypothetical protein
VTYDRDVARSLSPGQAVTAVALGHGTWGAIAYRRELREIARAGLADTVGDGIFNDTHARGPRAAAFWFMMITPVLGMGGYLADRAERAGDGQALKAAGRMVGATGLLGVTVMPRSGFPLSLPLALWLERRGRVLTRG